MWQYRYEKASQYLFFLIIIFVGVIIFLSYNNKTLITEQDLPTDQIKQLEIKEYFNERKITITNKTVIDSLIALVHKSEPIKIENPKMSSDLYFIKITNFDGSQSKFFLLEKKGGVKFLNYGTSLYKNDAVFHMIDSLLTVPK